MPMSAEAIRALIVKKIEAIQALQTPVDSMTMYDRKGGAISALRDLLYEIKAGD